MTARECHGLSAIANMTRASDNSETTGHGDRGIRNRVVHSAAYD